MFFTYHKFLFMGINPSSLEHFVKIAEIIPWNKKPVKFI